MHRNITWKFPVKLPLSQTSKNVMSFLFLFSLLQSERTEVWKRSCPGEGEVGREREYSEYGAKKFVHMHVNSKMIPIETAP
jgi:hypothetical protein